MNIKYLSDSNQKRKDFWRKEKEKQNTTNPSQIPHLYVESV